MLKVLLADDDHDDLELFEEALLEAIPTADLYTAKNGKEALQKLKASVPHIVFLDINMPEMSGWECLRLMKEDESLKHIPVIVFTTSSSRRDVEIASRLGASCLLTKPDRYDDLKFFLLGMAEAIQHRRLGPLKTNARLNLHQFQETSPD